MTDTLPTEAMRLDSIVASPPPDNVAHSMPSTASETFYNLAIRAIEEQEREIAGLRTRTGTLLAAAAVSATLLARSGFDGMYRADWPAWTASAIGLVGLGVVVLASVYLLRSHGLSFSLDAGVTYEEAIEIGVAEDAETLQIVLMYHLSDRMATNRFVLSRLRAAFALALGGLLTAVVGLGLGAGLACCT